MSTTQISFRYANSLFKLANQEAVLEDVYLSLSDLGVLLKKSILLAEFTRNPLLSQEDRHIILSRTFDNRLHPLVLKFLLFISAKNRLSFLEPIIQAFEGLYVISKNRIHAKIITAINVADEQKESILARLSKMHGKEIIPRWDIDSAVLGGFKIFIDGKLYDGSLSSQLEEFRQKVLT